MLELISEKLGFPEILSPSIQTLMCHRSSGAVN
uniref:Uncharacterized protein n=1 Tax=Anguilla anguilla TaxID=7936 RepID=A0A0E9SW96_ANGAN